jgi:hypothetical protein
MNRVKIFLNTSALLITAAAVAASSVKQQQFDYYQKGNVCVQIVDTTCVPGGNSCKYTDPATGTDYQIYDTRIAASLCATTLRLP